MKRPEPQDSTPLVYRLILPANASASSPYVTLPGPTSTTTESSDCVDRFTPNADAMGESPGNGARARSVLQQTFLERKHRQRGACRYTHLVIDVLHVVPHCLR